MFKYYEYLHDHRFQRIYKNYQNCDRQNDSNRHWPDWKTILDTEILTMDTIPSTSDSHNLYHHSS
jgi:hypothetical protein